MTFIITATMTAAAAYFIASLVCFVHDSIAAHRHTTQKAIAPATPAPVVKAKTSTIADVIRSEAARPKTGTVAKVDHSYNLPNSIRGLRQYIRDNALQQAIKAHLGKTVSKATKDELIAALMAIA